MMLIFISYGDGSIMSSVRFPRGQRLSVPRVPTGEMPLQPPPTVKPGPPASLITKLMPVVMIAGAAGMVAMLVSTGGFGSNPTGLLFPVMMGVSTLGMYASQRAGGQSAGVVDADRADYLRYLDQMRGEVQAIREDQIAAANWNHPEPKSLWSLAGTARMWERTPPDPDFGHVRVGVGDQRLARGLVTPETGPIDELEPVSAMALRRFVQAHSVVPDLATAVSLRSYAAVRFEGERSACQATVRAMIASLCTMHGPDHVVVAVLAAADVVSVWDWVKWLPHAAHPKSRDALGERRLFATRVADLLPMLSGWTANRARFSRGMTESASPHIVVIADGVDAAGLIGDAGIESVTLVSIGGSRALPTGRILELQVDGERLLARTESGLQPIATLDHLSVIEAEQVARRLAPYSIAASSDASDSRPGNDLIPHFDPLHGWRPRLGRDRLRVPVGVGDDGSIVELDLKEAAENGIGPHGLCIGATGSGKSEFLRTLVLGLIATHSPEQLNLVLVDFKGGATFLGLDGVNHVAAVITNLEAEATLVARMRDALAGELNRRQELLRSAGNFANVGDYERARAAGAHLAPLPALLIVVDEFSELLSQHPEFSELFVAIGRLGRSLHIHLLLSSQRLDEGRLRGVDSHLSYRISLKTFSASESRAVLGVPDAYHLPGTPGAAYLKSDASDLQRFQTTYVSGPRATTVGSGSLAAPSFALVRPMLFTAAHVPVEDSPPVAAVAAGNTSTVFDSVVAQVRGQGVPAHPVWLPPLDVSPALIDVLGPRLDIPIDRLASLSVGIGLVDRPFDQRRDQLTVDLSGAMGNAAIVGGPQSGKSTAARTLICALALTHTSRQVQFYCLDFGGGVLGGLSGLPHVGAVATRRDGDLVRRTVAEMGLLVRERERLFARSGVESMADVRRRGSSGDGLGDVFLVVDGYSVLRSEFEALEPAITAIAAQGLSYGVHVIVTSARWPELRPALKDQLGTKIELRLGDPIDSELGRRFAATVPTGRPGRGMTKDGHHSLIAIGGSEVLELIAQRNDAPPAPRVRLLPTMVGVDALADAEVATNRVPLGLRESDLGTAWLDFNEQAHLLVFGDSESGKTNVLRLIAQHLTATRAPSEVRIIVGDYRRTLLGVVAGDHLAGYAPGSALLATMMNDLAGVLRARLPGPDVTQQQLRERSWWSGPEIYLLVDDYDLVATGGDVLRPIVDFLAQAKDIGFHVVLARRSGGAARALFDPVIGRMREVSSAGFIMSGSREEGVLVGGVRPEIMPAGRGVLVTRETALVQAAWSPVE